MRRPQAERAIVLVGMPAAGKSSLGGLLARELGLSHVDLDEVVASDAGQSVPDLLRREGETAFRVREAAALQAVLAMPPAVVSTGGGAPVFHDGMAHMRQQAQVVWCDAPADVLVERTLLQGDRPLLGATRQEQLGALQALVAERTAVYAQAHVRVDASRPADVVLRDTVRALQAPTAIPARFGSLKTEVVVHGGHACDAADAIADEVRPGRVALVVDQKVAREALPLQTLLAARGVAVVPFEVPGGERSKDVRTLQRLWQGLAEHGFDRGDTIVALGGGATTDLAGFCAATWLRGVRLVHLPTTVLAMADASVGGKTAINLDAGKNLVGAFHPPRLVFAPLGALESLPGREWRSGLAEIAKMFACFDADAWQALRRDAQALRRRSVDHLRPHVVRAIELKAAVVAADPRETGDRALLNFGHTLGHAIEAESRYSVRHGEAVALGMVAAAELSEAQGWAPGGTAAELRAGLQDLDLPTGWEAHANDATLGRLGHDKKVRTAEVRFVASGGVGRAQLQTCRLDELAAMMRVLAAVPTPPPRRRER